MRTWAALTVALLLGCDPPVDPEAGCGVGPGSVEVGRVVGSRLESLPLEGGELPIIRGPQGGIHVLVGVWVDGLDLELDLNYRLRDPETGDRIGDETRLALRPSLFDRTGPRPERSPDLLILEEFAAPVEDFAGREAWLEAEAISTEGIACDSRRVTLLGD